VSIGARISFLGVAAALATLVGPGSGLPAVPAKLQCRHFLATVGSAGDMPYSVVQSLKPWMDLHHKAANGTAEAPVNGTADFQWAAESGDRWIVVYSERGSGHSRFALFAPIARNSATYRQVKPDGQGWFADPACRGIDAALDAHAGLP